MTPTDLIKLASRQVGVLGRGQAGSPEQLTDALELCNMMLGQWARKRWLVFHLLELQATGTGSAVYTIGPGSDFTIHWDQPGVSWDQSGLTWDPNFRTNRIESAFVRMNAGQTTQVDMPLRVVRAMEDWQAIPVKNLTGFPQIIFLDSGYPTGLVHVWPAPSSQYEIHILILNPLVRFDRLNVDINLPDEYQDAIFWNLCKRLRSANGKGKDPEVEQQAATALNTVRNANFQLPALRMPPDLVSARDYNIYSDTSY